MFQNIYQDKKVLITGHTGFKGAWLSLWLSKLGAKVVGLSLAEEEALSHFNSAQISELVEDRRLLLQDKAAVEDLIKDVQPDFIFNLAAQALVRKAYASPLETMISNALGTATLMECVRQNLNKCTVVMITSDKVYKNNEWAWGYRETDLIGGFDPYSASKGMAELAISCFTNSYFNHNDTQDIRIGIGRAGNVIGGGDWSEDRIVPDCVKSWSASKSVDIRNPAATRPWQHVLEPLGGYLHLGAALHQSRRITGEAYNFGPAAENNYSVLALITEMKKHWPSVAWQDKSENSETKPEAGLLKLSCDKALHELNWLPTLTFEETVSMTVDWYRAFYDGTSNTQKMSMDQIAQYCELAARRGQSWAL